VVSLTSTEGGYVVDEDDPATPRIGMPAGVFGVLVTVSTAERTDPALAGWIDRTVAFPSTNDRPDHAGRG
jgi:mannitol-1-phosphate/altronate dehydrogenase